MGFFSNLEADWRAYGAIPTFGRNNDMYIRYAYMFPKYTSNKPSKKRAKVKVARKANLKQKKKK